MAKLVLTNAAVKINSVDLSDHVKSLTLRVNKDIPDATSMTATWAEVLASTLHADATIEFFQDYAAVNVDATLWTAMTVAPYLTAGVVVKFAAAGTTGAATNPIYHGTAHINDYTPIGGSYGDVCMAPVSLTFTGGITRAVTDVWAA